MGGQAQRLGAPPWQLARGFWGGVGQDLRPPPPGVGASWDLRTLRSTAPPPPMTRRCLLLPPPGRADTSDATSLGSCRSEPSGAVGSPNAPRCAWEAASPDLAGGERGGRPDGRSPGPQRAGGAQQRQLNDLYIVALFEQPGPPAGVRAPSPRVWCRQRGRIRSVSASSLPPLLLPPVGENWFYYDYAFFSLPLCRFGGGMCEGGNRSGRQRIPRSSQC